MFGGTNNPVLNQGFGETIWDTRDRNVSQAKWMTVQGAAAKTLGLLAVVAVVATVVWTQLAHSPLLWPVALGGSLLAAVLTMVTCFKRNWSPALALPIAAGEGALVGGVSVMWTQVVAARAAAHATGVVSTLGVGLVMQAVLLTICVAAGMLLLNLFNIVRATPVFTKIVLSATIGVVLFSLAAIVMSMLGINLHLWDGGAISIGISLLIVAIAAANLVIDFDFIRAGADNRLPKHMEWFGAIGLMVTLVWLYTSILRLLAMLNRRD